MRAQAMAKTCERLKTESVEMQDFSALDFFAREGDWQIVVYAKEVKSLEAWEINPEFLPGLQRNLPGATLRIVDSYACGAETSHYLDFVVLDNPQADTFALSLKGFLLPFYADYFAARGFKVFQSFVQPRNDEYLAYAVFRLTLA